MNKKIDNYLENIQEGKVWDKVKKMWVKHKGKIKIGGTILGTAAAGGLAGSVGYKAFAKRAKDSWEGNKKEKGIK